MQHYEIISDADFIKIPAESSLEIKILFQRKYTSGELKAVDGFPEIVMEPVN